MDPKEFGELAQELNQHLRQTIVVFLAARGIPFNGEAFLSQTTIHPELFVREILYFGADIFPVPSKKDGE